MCGFVCFLGHYFGHLFSNISRFCRLSRGAIIPELLHGSVDVRSEEGVEKRPKEIM